MNNNTKTKRIIEAIFSIKALAQVIMWIVSGVSVAIITTELRLSRMEERIDRNTQAIRESDARIEFDDLGFSHPRIRAILNRHIDERTKLHLTTTEFLERLDDLYQRNPDLRR